MSTTEPPLSYAASSGPTNLQISSTLPQEVVQCLQNARFLHLATCTSLHPHVSLMNYTYLPSSPFSPVPVIIMTTHPSSKKTHNLLTNPHVSLLVHDWVSRRESTAGLSLSARSGSPPPSSLQSLLQNLNTREISSISVTINGEARLVDAGTEEERWLKERHLEENTNVNNGAEGGGGFWDDREAAAEGEGNRGYIEGEEVRVVVVRITDGRVSDWKGGVRDWRLEREEQREIGEGSLPNGVPAG